LRERREKLNQALSAIADEDFEGAKRLFRAVFYGVSSGKSADPGMSGSLLYHMAMVTKMETETRFLLEDLRVDMPDVAENLGRFYGDFFSDMQELTEPIVSLNVDPREVAAKTSLTTDEKIRMFTKLTEKTKAVGLMLSSKNPEAREHLEDLFREWSQHIVETRLRQEYETIKGFLITVELAKTLGIPGLRDAMKRVQEKFGEETVRIALEVTLNVGLRREKLQTVMLSDHYINYAMDVEKLDGSMQFLNCPIFASHDYISKELGIPAEVASLFCTHLC
jgi:hypothetical protein